MKLQSENIAFIKSSFVSLRTKEDFLILLNYTKEILYGEKMQAFEISQINYHKDARNNSKRYKQFIIKKIGRR